MTTLLCSLAAALAASLAAARQAKCFPDKLVVVEPGELRVRQALEAAAREAGLPLEIRTDRHFFTTAAEFAYYRSSATVLTMEVNTDRSVYFYLPGDIIKRDRLKMQPDFYYVQVDVGGTEQPLFTEAGRPVPDMANAMHKMFIDKKAFDVARSEADRAVNANNGMLRPHYLVPAAFYDSLPQGSPQPEFIREDASAR